MATTLINTVAFTDVGVGASVTAAHGLVINDTPIVPDLAAFDAADFSLVATSTDITVTNNGTAIASVDVLVMYWHSITRVIPAGDTNLVPQPFVISSGSGSGGSTTVTEWKQPVRAATTANITLSGTQTIDTVTLVAGDRVLVKNQTTGSENGIYVVAAGTWARSSDADSDSEVVSGISTFATEGDTNGTRLFFLITPDPITLGTTSLTFAPRGGIEDSDNTWFGLLSGAANTTGNNNVGIGENALTANTTGIQNTAVGSFAMTANTSGTRNVAVGLAALQANTTGTNNTAVGRAALNATSSGSSNTAVGSLALSDNTASSNTAVGSSALASNQGGTNNVAVGSTALGGNISGIQNTAVGNGALGVNTLDSNTAIGYNALAACNNGFDNAAVGALALSGLSNGTENVAAGFLALANATSAEFCTGIGSNALLGVTTGNNNTGLGGGVDVDSGTRTGAIIIGIDSAGTPAAGTVDDGLFFHTSLSTVAGTDVQYDATTGQMGPIASSRRFKENIAPIEVDTEKVFQLRPVSFDWKPGHLQAKGRQFGLIAEEVAELFPELVPLDKSGQPLSVNYAHLTVLLLAELKKLRDEVAKLKASHHEH